MTNFSAKFLSRRKSLGAQSEAGTDGAAANGGNRPQHLFPRHSRYRRRASAVAGRAVSQRVQSG
jgi:hypothetical protein